MSKTISNWGNFPVIRAQTVTGKDLDKISQYIKEAESLIARGNGRCYGDASLNKKVFSTLQLDKILQLDVDIAVIECEAGILFSSILEEIVPRGLFLPVTPGTRYITVGGAIAADVHGKNHHLEGSFAEHLISFDIMDENGHVITCSPSLNKDIFHQTIGGMGLTGIIIRAKFKLKKIESAYIAQQTIKISNLDSVMDLFEKSKASTYSVAWIDCLARGKNFGRSVLMLGEHAKVSELLDSQKSNPLHSKNNSKWKLPFHFPSFTINYITVKLFNFFFYHKHKSGTKRSITSYQSFFYPLDRVAHWNRIYGKNGFLQYQFVIPIKNSKTGVREILQIIQEHNAGSFLTVLKLFGKGHPQRPMSFPIEGYTLAIDFKVSEKVFALLDKLDKIVHQHGGRIYLAKDARMSKDTFQKTYPDSLVKNEKFQSLLSERLS